MGDQYLGEIRMVAFNFAPAGWALCNGAVLQITQNQALFALLGNRFGGDGVTTFALPDLQGRSPVGMGSGSGLQPIAMGQKGGSESTTLQQAEMPAHTHAITLAGTATDSVSAPTAKSNVLGASGPGQGSATIWSSALASPVALNPAQVAPAGSSQPAPLSLRNPYTGMNFIIALQGVFPPRG